MPSVQPQEACQQRSQGIRLLPVTDGLIGLSQALRDRAEFPCIDQRLDAHRGIGILQGFQLSLDPVLLGLVPDHRGQFSCQLQCPFLVLDVLVYLDELGLNDDRSY